MKKWLLAITLAAFATGPAFAMGNAAVGQQKSTACAACHGKTGISVSPQFPILAGQYYGYLLEALQQYKAGKRKNAIMNGMVSSLNENDMEDLAAYFSSQQGPLGELPTPEAQH